MDSAKPPPEQMGTVQFSFQWCHMGVMVSQTTDN